MNGKITVTITGEARVGKSTLAAILRNALKPVGCRVVLVDDTNAQLDMLNEHARKILRNRKVMIKTETWTRCTSAYPRTCMGRCICSKGLR